MLAAGLTGREKAAHSSSCVSGDWTFPVKCTFSVVIAYIK